MHRAVRAITWMWLGLALVCALDASVARAGTYEVAICHDIPDGPGAPTDGVSFPTSGAYVFAGVYEGCGAGGYIYATLDGIAPHGPSDLAAWEFQAPPGTAILSAQLYRSFAVGPVEPFQAPLVEIDTISAGAPSVLAWCTQSFSCSAAGTGPLTEFDAANVVGFAGATNVTAIEGTATCGGGQTCSAGSGGACPELNGDPCIASNHLYAMAVTLQDDSAPIAGSVSGSLVAPGVLSGVAGISFEATDTGSGLYSASLRVDGSTSETVPIDANGGHCVPIDGPGSPGAQTGVRRFDWTVPCVLAGSGTLTLDTTALSDGSHTVLLTVSDASGNTTTVWSGTIHTDNAPQGGTPEVFGDPEQGQTLAASTGSWSPAPTGYEYRWERCDAGGAGCVAIPGATSPAYTVSAADDYHQLAVSITAANADGSTVALSPTTGVVADANGYLAAPPAPSLAAGSLPGVAGTAREGDTLSAQPGSWTDGPLTYSYQWQSCDPYGFGCAAIPGATAASYRLSGADVGERVRVLVSANGPGGASEAASDASGLIASANGSTSALSPPSVATPSAAAPQRVANGIGACATARLAVTLDGASGVTVAFGRPVTLRGTLRCGAKPIEHATVDLAVAFADGSADARDTELRTGANGGFSVILRPGPSRRITLSYREYVTQSQASSHASAWLAVTPSISLLISPTSTVNGHTITFRGRVSGGDEPRTGLPLDLEYLEGSRWMIYTLIDARPGDGSFVYRYTFRRTTESITYTFRVAIPVTGVTGYPYQPAASAARSVHVDP